MPAQDAARQSMEAKPRVSIVLAPPKDWSLERGLHRVMIAPLQTALHVHGWNLASLLSGQGHGKDSNLQPGGCENQDDEKGPAPPRHGGHPTRAKPETASPRLCSSIGWARSEGRAGPSG